MTRTRYARTLAEAFPQDHAAAVEIYRRPVLERIQGVLLAIGIGVSLGLALFIELGA